MDGFNHRNDNWYNTVAEAVKAFAKILHRGDTMIVRLRLDGIETNELLILDDMEYIWLNDWYEGEKNVELVGITLLDDVDVEYRFD